jgi:hypothetical protein
MPRSSTPFIRSSKFNHARRNAAATLPDASSAPPSIDLADLRQRHPDVTDQQAQLCVAVALDGLSIQQCESQHRWPITWSTAQLAKTTVAAFLNELGMVALGADAHAARHCMFRLMTSAKSSYVRYAAAQDLMDRAGLRQKPQAQGPAAAHISINIGTTQPPALASVTIEQGAPEPSLPSDEAV